MTKYLNNIIEQDHRFIKRKLNPVLGFLQLGAETEQNLVDVVFDIENPAMFRDLIYRHHLEAADELGSAVQVDLNHGGTLAAIFEKSAQIGALHLALGKQRR